jgi:hypothetical protein
MAISESEWTHWLYLIVRATDNTQQNRDAMAAIVAATSGESVEDEKKMFQSAVRFGVGGTGDVVAFGLRMPVKPSMRLALLDFVNNQLTNPRWYVARNCVKAAGQFTHQLTHTNDNVAPLVVPNIPPWDTTPFRASDVLADLLSDYNLEIISD